MVNSALQVERSFLRMASTHREPAQVCIFFCVCVCTNKRMDPHTQHKDPFCVSLQSRNTHSRLTQLFYDRTLSCFVILCLNRNAHNPIHDYQKFIPFQHTPPHTIRTLKLYCLQCLYILFTNTTLGSGQLLSLPSSLEGWSGLPNLQCCISHAGHSYLVIQFPIIHGSDSCV